MSNIPDIIFIVPYRDRESQKNVFLNHMEWLLEGKNYEIFIAHQDDRRFFNRGAMKDLGFLYAKEKYPNNYKEITFVFHDVDCLVSKKDMTNFQTKKGSVKHIFGFKQTFGGIFSIKGGDFESINGFPCIWNWGYEDNALRVRWIKKNGGWKNHLVDYSEFYGFKDKKIVQMWHGDKKIFNAGSAWKAYADASSFKDGNSTIRNITKTIEKDDKITTINIKSFSVLIPLPSLAQKKVLVTLQDFSWGPKSKPRAKHVTQKNFSKIFGFKR